MTTHAYWLLVNLLQAKSYGERAQYFMVRIHYSKQLQTILLLETYFFL